MGKDGHTYNINAETAASHIAVTLKAQKIIFLTDVKGIMNNDQLISEISKNDIQDLIDSKIISGGMVPKVKGMLHTLEF